MNEEKDMKAGWMTMTLAFVATFAFLFVVGTSGAGPDADTDGDGVQDNQDNCVNDVNANQKDSDADGYGNVCDQDYNNDGGVGGLDFGRLVAAFGSTQGDANYDDAVDCNGDEGVGGLDFGCLVASFGSSIAGESGRACAGSIPCPAGPTLSFTTSP
jgi:hypothetical protein